MAPSWHSLCWFPWPQGPQGLCGGRDVCPLLTWYPQLALSSRVLASVGRGCHEESCFLTSLWLRDSQVGLSVYHHDEGAPTWRLSCPPGTGLEVSDLTPAVGIGMLERVWASVLDDLCGPRSFCGYSLHSIVLPEIWVWGAAPGTPCAVSGTCLGKAICQDKEMLHTRVLQASARDPTLQTAKVL